MAFTVYFCLIAYSFLLCCSISSCLASYYDVCNEVPKCGVFDFGYPFGLKYSGCGDPDFQLQCDYGSGNALINIGGDDYRILGHSFTNNSMKIMNNNLWGDKCNFPGNYSQFWLSASHFHIADTYTNLTIWGLCNKSTEAMSQLRLLQLCGDDWYYNIRRPEQGMRFCKTHFQLPIHKDYLHFNMKQSFPWQGFEVSWRVDPNRCESCGACLNSIGNCGYDIRKPTSFLCYCPDGSTHPDRCPDNGRFLKKYYKLLSAWINHSICKEY